MRQETASIPFLSIVIPVYCEEGQLQQALHAVRSQVESLTSSYEIILVDDGSTDNTWREIQTLRSAVSAIHALRFSRNFGKEAAILAGLTESRGQGVIVMDADLQHPPSLIPEMVRLWSKEGYQVVDAVKADRGQELALYRTCAKVFNRLMTKCSGFQLSGASDFKLLDRKVVNALLALPERLTFYRGLTEWLGFRHARLPMEVGIRTGGGTKWSTRRLVRLALTALLSFSTAPLHIVTILGCVFLLIALYLAAGVFYNLLSGQALSGFPTVILLQLIIGSAIMISLGVMGEYLAGIYNEIKARPRYIVTETLRNDQTDGG